eukprot:scaffold23250_cov31-Tisochrysis_lutea.AAC.7
MYAGYYAGSKQVKTWDELNQTIGRQAALDEAEAAAKAAKAAATAARAAASNANTCKPCESSVASSKRARSS